MCDTFVWPRSRRCCTARCAPPKLSNETTGTLASGLAWIDIIGMR